MVGYQVPSTRPSHDSQHPGSAFISKLFGAFGTTLLVGSGEMYSFLCSALLVSLVCGSDLSLRGSGNVETTKINVTETERANRETVTIDVQRMEVDRDKDGVFEDAKILKVSAISEAASNCQNSVMMLL